MGSSFGRIFRVSTFGESHGGAVGVILDGCPPNLKIDIEYLILKRRLYENIQYPQKRIQTFSPASGKPSVNKVMARLQEFIDECYDDEGNILANEYEKCAKHKKCILCRDL